MSQQQPSAPSAPSALGRIGTLVSTASHRAYQQTTHGLQRAKAKGQELATWIPIVVSAGFLLPRTLFWADSGFRWDISGSLEHILGQGGGCCCSRSAFTHTVLC